MAAYQASCVAIGKRAVMIEGPAGSGKSSLALALIDRGALLIGDDGIVLEAEPTRLLASPHPNTRGLIEIRNLGLLAMETTAPAPVCLLIRLDEAAPRFVEAAESAEIEGIAIPAIRLTPKSANLAIKAEMALERYGLPG